MNTPSTQPFRFRLFFLHTRRYMYPWYLSRVGYGTTSPYDIALTFAHKESVNQPYIHASRPVRKRQGYFFPVSIPRTHLRRSLNRSTTCPSPSQRHVLTNVLCLNREGAMSTAARFSDRFLVPESLFHPSIGQEALVCGEAAFL